MRWNSRNQSVEFKKHKVDSLASGDASTWPALDQHLSCRSDCYHVQQATPRMSPPLASKQINRKTLVQIQSFQTMALLPSCKKNCWPLRCLREASVRLSLEEKYIPARPQTTMRANKKAMVHADGAPHVGMTPWQSRAICQHHGSMANDTRAERCRINQTQSNWLLKWELMGS